MRFNNRRGFCLVAGLEFARFVRVRLKDDGTITMEHDSPSRSSSTERYHKRAKATAAAPIQKPVVCMTFAPAPLVDPVSSGGESPGAVAVPVVSAAAHSASV